MKRWQRIALALAVLTWLVGCGLRADGRLPGSWWLWTAPYWLTLAVAFVVGVAWIVGSHLFVNLAGRYHAWQDRRDDERLRAGILRSLEADFLHGTGLSGRSENRPPVRPDPHR